MYVPLDVNFPDNDKVVNCSLAGIGLYVTALCLCKRLQHDGDVSKVLLRRYGDDGTATYITELVDAGLFEDAGDAIRMPAWLGHNQASDEYMSSDKGSRMAHTRWHEGRGVVKAGCEWCEEETSRSMPVDADPMPVAMPDDASGHMQEVEVEKEKDKTPACISTETHTLRAKQACMVMANRDISDRIDQGEDIARPSAVGKIHAEQDLWPVHAERLTALAAEHPDATDIQIADMLRPAEADPWAWQRQQDAEWRARAALEPSRDEAKAVAPAGLLAARERLKAVSE